MIKSVFKLNQKEKQEELRFYKSLLSFVINESNNKKNNNKKNKNKKNKK